MSQSSRCLHANLTFPLSILVMSNKMQACANIFVHVGYITSETTAVSYETRLGSSSTRVRICHAP